MALIQKLTARRKAATKGLGDTRRALSELRALGARLRDQRAEIEARPVTLEQAQVAASEALHLEAARVLDDLSLSSLAKPGDCRTPTLRLNDRDMAALAFAASADGAAAAVRDRLADHYQKHGLQGLDAEDRDAQLAKIEAECLACELAEEAIIRDLEEDGVAPLRRPDADPRALLADSRELK